MKIRLSVLVGLLNLATISFATPLPKHFQYLQHRVPSILQDIRYASDDNFIGRPIKGYQQPQCILTRPTIDALAKVQRRLSKQHLNLKVYDCYRPQMAVNDFIAWSRQLHDTKMKAHYYPRVRKADFFKLGYVAARSGHTRGSTVDLTIVDTRTGQTLDMGTHWDFLDSLSHPFARQVNGKARANRMLLRRVMLANGFRPLSTEWWHFTLRGEPYPKTYFNFPVQ
jgi:zinc D-Ala-D-Ala dipeptidase